MSMIGNFRRLPEAELRRLLDKPSSIMAFLYPEGDPDLSADQHLDIDKSWHLIHFLLTGDPWQGAEPLCHAVLGGTEIGEEDVGYGPARHLTPMQVGAVSSALDAIPPADLWSRFDAQRAEAADIYPSGWEDGDTERGYILGYFESLRDFFRDVAQQREAMILYLN